MRPDTTPLPAQTEAVFLTDGGLETSLIFEQGIELPQFAAFPLLASPEGRESLRTYFEPFLALAHQHQVGFLLDTPTWRANPEWGTKLGFSPSALDDIQHRAVAWARELRRPFHSPDTPVPINGAVGPRGDGYRVEQRMTVEEARQYHLPQLKALQEGGADMATAVTMNYPEEAIGIALAARDIRMPVAISFTVETEGQLASGDELPAAIAAVEAASGGWPLYYMINCAHPTHFMKVVQAGGEWTKRLRGIRANASALSHAELDAAEELDAGDPQALGQDYRELRSILPHFSVMGGCCGTGQRHLRAICEACLPARTA
ncbi:homocysteine S-methyltransferase [Acetobacteraceae bacterium AT-5844]|nr:homocysteine S-methyltransferase [Acetobacteraceae bacterium AT-5844]